jgi:hypothetical protein
MAIICADTDLYKAMRLGKINSCGHARKACAEDIAECTPNSRAG